MPSNVKEMKKNSKCKESKSSSDKSENLKRFLLLEPKVLIQLKLEVMDYWRRCRLLSSERGLNTRKGRSNKILRRRGKITLQEKTKKPTIYLKLPQKFKMLVTREKLIMMHVENRNKKSKQPWKPRNRL